MHYNLHVPLLICNFSALYMQLPYTVDEWTNEIDMTFF